MNPSTITMATEYALNVIGALLLLAAGWVCAGWVKRMLERQFKRAALDMTLTKFLANIIRYAILALIFVSCLSRFGFGTTSFAAVLASAGFAVGLALQGNLRNFSAGGMLPALRPSKVGDVVKIAGEIGVVDEIERFTTRIDTPDNRRIIIPNAQVFGSKIENITYHEARRVDVAVGTDYLADLDETRQALEAAANAVEGRIGDRDIAVVLSGLGASSIDWEVRVWAPMPDFLAVKQRLTHDVKAALDAVGIGIRFPQIDVHFDRPDEAA
jgi:small conductance mechanosensitive channel